MGEGGFRALVRAEQEGEMRWRGVMERMGNRAWGTGGEGERRDAVLPCTDLEQHLAKPHSRKDAPAVLLLLYPAASIMPRGKRSEHPYYVTQHLQTALGSIEGWNFPLWHRKNVPFEEKKPYIVNDPFLSPEESVGYRALRDEGLSSRRCWLPCDAVAWVISKDPCPKRNHKGCERAPWVQTCGTKPCLAPLPSSPRERALPPRKGGWLRQARRARRLHIKRQGTKHPQGILKQNK